MIAEGDGDNNSAVDERGGPEDLLPFVAKADIIVMCCMLNEETVGAGWRKWLGPKVAQ